MYHAFNNMLVEQLVQDMVVYIHTLHLQHTLMNRSKH